MRPTPQQSAPRGDSACPRSLRRRTTRRKRNTSTGGTAEASRATGRALRDAVPFDAHAAWQPAPDRPDPVERVLASNAGREERLVPLRMARMAASPFAFLRGSATVMAWDLAQSPSIGHTVMIDGDAHVNNFGLFRTPRQDVVFDLNDFDETLVAPWEWDLKRLTASINVAARENGVDADGRDRAVRSASAAYRTTMGELAQVSAVRPLADSLVRRAPHRRAHASERGRESDDRKDGRERNETLPRDDAREGRRALARAGASRRSADPDEIDAAEAQ